MLIPCEKFVLMSFFIVFPQTVFLML